MNEHVKNNPSEPSSEESDAVALLKKMQQQLVFLERKIDTLIHQSQNQPSKDRHFSKPFRPSFRPNQGKGEHSHRDSHRSKDRFDQGQGRSFDRQPSSNESRGFGHGRPSFPRRRRTQ